MGTTTIKYSVHMKYFQFTWSHPRPPPQPQDLSLLCRSHQVSPSQLQIHLPESFDRGVTHFFGGVTEFVDQSVPEKSKPKKGRHGIPS